MSMLAEQLWDEGHDVVRWASDFSHELGRPRFNKRNQVKVKPGYKNRIIGAYDFL